LELSTFLEDLGPERVKLMSACHFALDITALHLANRFYRIFEHHFVIRSAFKPARSDEFLVEFSIAGGVSLVEQQDLMSLKKYTN
jgi:hypothetical protein